MSLLPLIAVSAMPSVVYIGPDYAEVPCTRALQAALADPRAAWAFEGIGDYKELGQLDTDPSTYTTVLGTPVVVDGLDDPDGGTDAFSVEDNESGQYVIIRTPAAFSNSSSPGRFQCVTKVLQDEIETRFPEFRFYITGGGGSHMLRLNTKTGSYNVTSTAGFTDTAESVVDSGDGWWIITQSGQADYTSSLQFYQDIVPAMGTAEWTNSATAVGTITVFAGVISRERAWTEPNTTRVFSDEAIFIEEGRTNSFPKSRRLSATTLLNSPTVTDDDATAPDGSETASLIEFAVGGALGQVRDLMPDGEFTDAGKSVVSFYVKDPGEDDVNAIFRDKNNVNTFMGATPMTAEWSRISLVVDNDTGTTDPLLALYESTDGADFHAWGLQGEDGAFLTSPIYTDTGSETRPPDLPLIGSGDDLGGLFNAQAVEFDFWPMVSSADLVTASTNNPVLFGFSGTNCMIRISVGGASVYVGVYLSAGALMAQKACTFDALDKLTVTVDVSAGTLELSGFTTGDGVATGTSGTLSTSTACKIGMHGNTAATSWQFNGLISRLRAG